MVRTYNDSNIEINSDNNDASDNDSDNDDDVIEPIIMKMKFSENKFLKMKVELDIENDTADS